MLVSDTGPWSPEHIYQEIVGYGKTRQRGNKQQGITPVDICHNIFVVSSIPTILVPSERGGGAAGVLADEGRPRREPQERRAGDLRVRARLGPALRLLRHAARRVLFREVSSQFIT